MAREIPKEIKSTQEVVDGLNFVNGVLACSLTHVPNTETGSNVFVTCQEALTAASDKLKELEQELAVAKHAKPGSERML